MKSPYLHKLFLVIFEYGRVCIEIGMKAQWAVQVQHYTWESLSICVPSRLCQWLLHGIKLYAANTLRGSGSEQWAKNCDLKFPNGEKNAWRRGDEQMKRGQSWSASLHFSERNIYIYIYMYCIGLYLAYLKKHQPFWGKENWLIRWIEEMPFHDIFWVKIHTLGKISCPKI